MEPAIRVSRELNASVVVGHQILPNKFDLSFTINLITNNQYEQKMVYERIKFMTESMFESTIFIKHGNPLLKVINGNFANTYSQLHEEPYDSIVVDYLYLKAQAILENKAIIDQLSLSSWQGREVEFYAEAEHDYSAYNKASWIRKKDVKPWYLRSDIWIGDYRGDASDVPNWEDLGLGWKTPKDEKTQVIQFNKFKGKLVKGGKSAN